MVCRRGWAYLKATFGELYTVKAFIHAKWRCSPLSRFQIQHSWLTAAFRLDLECVFCFENYSRKWDFSDWVGEVVTSELFSAKDFLDGVCSELWWQTRVISRSGQVWVYTPEAALKRSVLSRTVWRWAKTRAGYKPKFSQVHHICPFLNSKIYFCHILQR